MKYFALFLFCILHYELYAQITTKDDINLPLDSIVLETSPNWSYISCERLWPANWDNDYYIQTANKTLISALLKVDKNIIILGRPPLLFQNDLYVFDTFQEFTEYFQDTDITLDNEIYTLTIRNKFGDKLCYGFNPVFYMDFCLEMGQIQTNNIAIFSRILKIGTDIKVLLKRLGLPEIDFHNSTNTYKIFFVPDDFYLNNSAIKFDLLLGYQGVIIVQVVENKIYSIDFTLEDIYTEYIWKEATEYN